MTLATRKVRLNTLTGQLITVMLLALGVSFLVTLAISRSETQRALVEVRREDCVGRTAALAALLRGTPDELHADILRSVNSPFNRYWTSPAREQDTSAWLEAARPQLLAVRVPVSTGDSEVGGVVGEGEKRPLFAADDLPEARSQWVAVRTLRGGTEWSGHYMPLSEWNGMGAVFPVREGLYVNHVSAKPYSADAGTYTLYASFLISAAAISVGSLVVARRLGKPLRRLAQMAERVGRGEELGALPEEGAADVQSTAAALNRMQARVRRFVEDRTNMVAAMSHDLRTPITSLRLRAEFVKEPETREKMIATLDELQSMVDATLAFARGESVSEATRLVDLRSLVDSLCCDLADLGWDVSAEDGPRVPVRCRPEALNRALRNLIENAVRYGSRARVRLAGDGEHHEVLIDDDGPGIPEGDMERVFAPFVRLEESRNRATGGVGLGLSVARTIIHAHGGDIRLSNRPGGGLRVTIRLPKDR